MRKITLTILLVAAVVAAWAQKPDKKTAKLEKQLKDIEKWLAGVRGRLANEKFVKSAPEQVVADARKNLEELEEKKRQTEEILAGLK